MRAHVPRILFALALFLTTLLYWPGLNGPLLFDDNYNLEPLTYWLSGERTWDWVVFTNRSGVLGRPVSMASFVLNMLITGDGVWGLKLGNLILHLLGGVLIYVLFSALVARQALWRGIPDGLARWIPCIGAAVWLVHPMYVSTVLYVIQRMAMLSALFMLLGMVAYMAGRSRLMAGKRLGGISLLVGTGACTVLATLSKENGILLPSLCAVLEIFAFMPPPGRRRHWLSQGFILCALVLPAVLAIGLTLAGHPKIVDGYLNRPFTLPERLLTEARVMWSYVGGLILPFGPQLGLYHDDYRVSTGLLSPPTTLIAILAWCGAIALAWRTRRSIPALGLGLGIFLVGQAVESSVFPLLLYFEHRTYLPGIGVIWAFMGLASLGMTKLAPRLDKPWPVFAGGAITIIAALALATSARALVWQTRDAILAQSLAHHSQSRGLRLDLIADATNTNPPDYVVAERHAAVLRESHEPDTQRVGATISLILGCMQKQTPPEKILSMAFDGRPKTIQADHLLAIERLAEYSIRDGCPGLEPKKLAPRLARMLENAKLPKDDFFMHRLRFVSANLYVAANDGTNALIQAHLGYGGKRGEEPIGFLLSHLQYESGDVEGARETLEQASKTLPDGDLMGRKMIDDQLEKMKSGKTKTGANPN